MAIVNPTYADFTIINGQVVTIPQSLNDNETGTIEAGGQLNVAGTAITASGVDISVNNDGSISTTDMNAIGITSQGNSATITNSGSIATIGQFSSGIHLGGPTATLTNSGSIATTGVEAHGIFSFDTAIINNSGSIVTTGADANGIFSFDTATTNNSGSIVTTGADAHGIRAEGANASMTNSGSIVTTGIEAYGIVSFGDNATINNSGSITTTGADAIGIFSTGADARITNSLSITTAGPNAHGIFSFDTATITNSGGIVTIGVEAHGIFSFDGDTTINNSGLISATGAMSYAILADDNNITLNLLAGSQIIGPIDLGSAADNDTINIYGGSASANLSFTNVENINLIGATGFVDGNTVTTIDPTGESSRSVALSGVTSSIHSVVSQRMAHTTPLKPIQLASLTLSPGMLFQQRQPVAWAQVFGGSANHDAEGGSLAYDTDHLGFTLGYEWDINKTRFGLLGGVVHSKTKTDIASFKTQSDGYYVGGYGHFNLGSFKLTTSLLGGYSNYDNDRVVIDNINGREVAKSDFDSFFISPSLTVSSAYALADRLEFRPSASINYSVAWLDGYREKGTTSSNLKVDDRTLKIVTARVQLATAYQFNSYSEFEFRMGLSSRHNNDDDTDVSIAGNSFSYANAGDENVSGRFAGVNLRVTAHDNLSLMVDMEFGGDSDEHYVNGQVSLEYSF